MPYQAIDIPAGVYRHGTDLEGAGRWRDVNLVRWRNGSLSPVGGWQKELKQGQPWISQLGVRSLGLITLSTQI